MNEHRPARSFSAQQYDMYDDRPRDEEYRDTHRNSSQSYQASRNENQITPPRGPAGDRTFISAHPESGYREDRHYHGREHVYDRSRSPRREARGRYIDGDREEYQSPQDRSRSRSRSLSRNRNRNRNRNRSRSPYFGAPANRNVILEGLPIDMTQEDILHELRHNLRLEGLEEVRLIKDKKTGQSRQFAFAQFTDVSNAKTFLNQYYPMLSLHRPQDSNQNSSTDPAKVRIAYSRDRDDKDWAGKSDDDWKCEICNITNFPQRTLCFRCNAPRTRATAHGIVVAAHGGQNTMSAFSGFATTGDSDASPDDTPSQFLLLRGLEPGVTEELLAKGVSKLYRAKPPTPSLDVQTTKKSKISSTSGDTSLGAKEGSLCRVLLVRDRKSNDSWRYGFAEFRSVEDAQLAMAKYKSSEKFTISSKPVLLSYIHAGVFVPVLYQSSEQHTEFTFSPLLDTDTRLMYWDEAAYASEHLTSIISQTPLAKKGQSEHAKLAAAAANEGLVSGGKDGEPRSKKRKIEKEQKNIVAPHLQFWTNRHAELHGIPSNEVEDSPVESLVDKPSRSQGGKSAEPSNHSFADLERMCCLLCSRQFKNVADVKKHERMSQLHRDNMQNSELVVKATIKLVKSSEIGPDSSAYRDRAKERRQAFNQPKQPSIQSSRTLKDTGGRIPSDSVEVVAPAPTKGAALLEKMGWTAGEGLGSQGNGRTEAIATELYTQGVGLGAEGGKVGDATAEAERQTKGNYADFLSKTKEKAKERFQSLG